MWVRRPEAALIGLCQWCQNGIQEGDEHHWHEFNTSTLIPPWTDLYCIHCAITAGWVPNPYEQRDEETVTFIVGA